MAITLADFDKIWASTSPLTPYSFSEANYKRGWNFIGATPPARQMWDSYMKASDEKHQWLYNNKLSLSGGTMKGSLATTIDMDDGARVFILAGGNTQGGGLGGGRVLLYGKTINNGNVGGVTLSTFTDTMGRKDLILRPDGTCAWDSKIIERISAIGTTYIRYESGFQMCWGRVEEVTTTPQTVVFPLAFANADYAAAFGCGSATSVMFGGVTTTSMELRVSSGTATVRYVVIGRWK